MSTCTTRLTIIGAILLILSPPSHGSAVAVDDPVVPVSDINQLYAEFYNPNNAGAVIDLAPGLYVLNPTAPNGGRLVFGPQTAKAIKGSNQYIDADGDGVPDPLDLNMNGVPDVDLAGKKIFAAPTTETIIDGSGLMLTPIGVLGFIELRAQPETEGTSQSVSKITLRGNNTPRAAIIVQGITNSALNATISGCIVQDSPRGIMLDARSANPAGQNAQLNVLLEGNVVRDSGSTNPPGLANGWGVQTQQLMMTSGLKFSLDIRRNRFYGNRVNLFLVSQGTQDSRTSVISRSNVYEESVLASDPTSVHVLSAGIAVLIRNSGNVSGVHGAQIKLASTGDAIWNNGGWAGVYAELRRDSNGAEFAGNSIDVDLVETRFVKLKGDGSFDGAQNRDARTSPPRRRDVAIVGLNDSNNNLPYPQATVLTGPTIDNKVKVKVRKATTSLMPTFYDNNPQPFVVFDSNALPGQLHVELDLKDINYVGF